MEEEILSTGTLRAREEIQLKSEAAGRVVSLPLKEGTRVPRGRLLVKLNDESLQAQLIKARAALKVARTNLARQSRLLEEKFISQQEYDIANQAAATALGDLGLLEAQIALTEIRAPFDGVVGLKLVSLGSYLTPGTPVANFLSDRPLKVDFSVPEQYFDSVAPGKSVVFTIQGDSLRHLARVYAVDPKVDEQTRTVNVRAVCDPSDSALTPGAFARLTLVFREKPDALAIPSQALVPTQTGQQVYVVRQGAAVSRPVRTGLRTAAKVEITEGLRPGDTVVTTGVTLVRPGSQVEIKGLDTSSAAASAQGSGRETGSPAAPGTDEDTSGRRAAAEGDSD
jgi:membrane fusion protein (multidrug efflux system)